MAYLLPETKGSTLKQTLESQKGTKTGSSSDNKTDEEKGNSDISYDDNGIDINKNELKVELD